MSPYEFGYSWFVGYGLVVPLVLAGVLAAVAATFLINVVFGINRPMALPTARFLPGGEGRVLDAGAGSGRAAVGVLLARPKARVVSSKRH
jgi:hypothetical protein